MSWTEDRVTVLKRLWGEGLSASGIAARIGGVTRNAVIGKVHRLNLSGRARPATRMPRPRASKPLNAVGRGVGGMIKARVAAVRAYQPPAPARRPIEDIPVPVSLNVPLLDLSDKLCKFPTTPHQALAVDIRFCGHPAWNGLPYCEYHARLAYQPVDRRRGHDGRPSQVSIQEKGNLAAAAFDADLSRLAGGAG